MRNFREYKIDLDKLSQILFVFTLCVLAFICGATTYHYKMFPFPFIEQAREGMAVILSYTDLKMNNNYYSKTDFTTRIPTYKQNAAYNGPSLVAAVVENNMLSARVIDMNGEPIHEWNIDWFEIWPDATHIPDEELPQSQPGTHIHGAELLNNGDLVFNFDYLGLVRLDVCSDVVWRLPYRTHHSIYRDEYDSLWVAGEKRREHQEADFPNYEPPIREPTVLKISLDGKILKEISILELLKENHLQGLLVMSSLEDGRLDPPTVSGDTMHLNDVETFPSFMEEGVFKAGDIMVSLRNINTVLIFRESDLKITYMSIGEFVRQHDPDFIDGNTISIFDNNNIAAAEYGHQSRIFIKSFADNQSNLYYTGRKDEPFYTSVMGKHQWLPNGNLLITETMKGRAFEIDPQGNIVWEYINIVDEGYVGIVEEAQRLSGKYTKEFFDQNIQECSNTNN